MKQVIEINRVDIKNILIERKLFVSLASTLEYETEFVLDSLSLLWFVDGLEQHFGIKLDAEEDWEAFTSIQSIFNYLQKKGY